MEVAPLAREDGVNLLVIWWAFSLIERAHEAASHHIGKVPRRIGSPLATENDLIRLRRELLRAVDDEQFERAAKIRDHIRNLETP